MALESCTRMGGEPDLLESFCNKITKFQTSYACFWWAQPNSRGRGLRNRLKGPTNTNQQQPGAT